LAVLTVAVIAGKTIGVTFASILSGVGTKSSIGLGMSLAQIGEFSFIIAGAGLKSGATNQLLYTLAVAVSAITTFLTPYMIRSSSSCADFVSRRLPGPLKVLESLYDSWFERIRQTAAPTPDSRSIVWPIATIVSSAIVLAAILIINERDPLDLTTTVSNLEHLSYFRAGLFVDAFALLVCAAPAAGLYFGSRRLATALASRAFPDLSADEIDAGKAIVEMLHVTILLVVAVPLLAIVQPFIGSVEGIGIVVISIVLITIVVIRSARRMQSRMLEAAGLIRAALRGLPATARGDRRAYEVPGIGMVTPVIVQSASGGVGKRLSEIDLQTNSGAVVVAIARDGENVVVPTGEEVLRAGDVLELAGSSDALASAIRLLNAPPGAAGDVSAPA
jgi:CPA2 family monovalent cation:H+ antiporter-2